MTDHPEKPAHVSQTDWDAADVPEMSDEEFALAVPFKDAHPAVYASWKRSVGRPTIHDVPKVHVGFRLAADVVMHLRASGRGYGARVEEVLRDAIAKGIL